MTHDASVNSNNFGTKGAGCYFCTPKKKRVDLVAQLVEHNTFNVRALGSSPSGITVNRPVMLILSAFQAFFYPMASLRSTCQKKSLVSFVSIQCFPPFSVIS